jgi:aminobenzoyl-glutamate utilization protein B
MKKQDALQSIVQKKDRIIDVNNRVWDAAELAFNEFQSMAVICEALEAEGFAVEKSVGHVETAFTGRFGSGKPVIGILGEFDALSGLSQEAGNPVKTPIKPGAPGHGCGHNCLGAASLAAAIGVKEYLKSTGKSGTVIYFGCPGEEGGSGKAFMAREGVFDELDAAITWHPSTRNGIATGSSNANYQVAYKFYGVASHAAGDPHLGRSALDAVELMNVGVQFLREHMIDAARIHYAITDTGGFSPNVVQPYGEVLYLIRSPRTSQVEELYQRVNDIARGAALMTGTRMEMDFVKACSNVIVNTALEKILYKNMQAIPIPTYTEEEKAFAGKIIESYESKTSEADKFLNTWGQEATEADLALLRQGKTINDFLMPFKSSDKPSPGSTDVGDVSWVCPTAQINAVTTAAGTPGHSWQYVACNKTSIAHKGVLYAGQAMAGAVIDLIEDPKLLDEVKAEFLKRLGGETYQCPIPKGVKPRKMGGKM